jgi:hypothetical protein
MESWLATQNPVFTFNTRGGNVTLTLGDVSIANNSVSGVYPTAPTPPTGDVSANIATTAFVAATVAAAGVSSFNTRVGAVTLNAADLTGAGGLLLSAAAATVPPMDGAGAAGVSTSWARADHQHPTDITRSPLASPAFTGTPTAPTPAAGDSSQNIATTAFVHGYLPLAGGTVTGATIFNTNVTSQGLLSVAGYTTATSIQGNNFTSATPLRWAMRMPNSNTETGSNVGSDFNIASYSDTGTAIETPFTIIRSTGQVSIKGSGTNDNAAANFVGEFLATSITAAVSLTTATTANVGTISLTGGDWDVWGVVVFTPAATTTVTAVEAGVSTITAFMPNASSINAGSGTVGQIQATLTTGVQQVVPTGTMRIRVASTASPTTFYLVAQAAFAVSTLTVTGYISARRRR